MLHWRRGSNTCNDGCGVVSRGYVEFPRFESVSSKRRGILACWGCAACSPLPCLQVVVLSSHSGTAQGLQGEVTALPSWHTLCLMYKVLCKHYVSQCLPRLDKGSQVASVKGCGGYSNKHAFLLEIPWFFHSACWVLSSFFFKGKTRQCKLTLAGHAVGIKYLHNISSFLVLKPTKALRCFKNHYG